MNSSVLHHEIYKNMSAIKICASGIYFDFDVLKQDINVNYGTGLAACY